MGKASEPTYVQTPQALSELVETLRGSRRVGLDTEFVSEGSYEPVLCLVQLATDEGLWIVDPFARIDLRPLWETVTAPEREFIAAAAREEIRFCLRGAGRGPQNLIDVQLAAGLVGYSHPLSHTNLVREVLGVTISGGEAFTDWRQRPLSPRQLEYAADDVRYLLPVRDRIMEAARGLGREEWVRDECARLVERVSAGETEERWRRISGTGRLRARELAVVRELWRWRDEEARRANLPPRKVLRDELLVEIAKRQPTTLDDLFALRGLERGAIRKEGPAIVRAVQTARQLRTEELPQSQHRRDPPQVARLAQFLSVVVSFLAAQHRVDASLLATTADLQDLVRWELDRSEARPALMEGWRGEILGGPLAEVLEGKRHVRIGNLRAPDPLVLEPHEG